MASASLVLILVAVVVGMGYPLQAGINATIAQHHGHPLLAALTNTTVASLALLVLIVFLRVPLPAAVQVAAAPWWAWTGGLLGAGFVFSALVLAPKLGAAVFVSSGIVGTMAASLLIDHYGIIGYREQPITGLRLTGAALVVIGMILIQWKR